MAFLNWIGVIIVFFGAFELIFNIGGLMIHWLIVMAALLDDIVNIRSCIVQVILPVLLFFLLLRGKLHWIIPRIMQNFYNTQVSLNSK